MEDLCLFGLGMSQGPNTSNCFMSEMSCCSGCQLISNDNPGDQSLGRILREAAMAYRAAQGVVDMFS